MKCECGSTRILNLSAKSSDRNHVYMIDGEEKVIDQHGYVPSINFLGRGDYIDISVCMDCGKLQGFQQMTNEEILESSR